MPQFYWHVVQIGLFDEGSHSALGSGKGILDLLQIDSRLFFCGRNMELAHGQTKKGEFQAGLIVEQVAKPLVMFGGLRIALSGIKSIGEAGE